MSASYCRTGYCPSSLYYYEAIMINVHTTGDYSISSNGTLNTYGYLYNDTFDPTYPSNNLLQMDDNGGGSNQFKISMVLSTMVDYILVVTTSRPSAKRAFSIIVQGPAVVSLSFINSTGE